jgi:hypothetical protein
MLLVGSGTSRCPQADRCSHSGAIVNSIQAIEDATESDGMITIKIIRDLSPMLIDVDKSTREITDFEIADNGIGFDDENFAAFQTSDTTYKADRGGKGIGRFVWLVAFDSVEVAVLSGARS